MTIRDQVCRVIDCSSGRLFDFHDRFSMRVGDALSVGTTLTTRLWVSLFSLSLAGQIGLSQPSLFSHAGMQGMLHFVPAGWWGLAMTVSGLLMLWRTASKYSRPWIAWMSNCLAFGLWSAIVSIRFVMIGSASLASTSTVIALMSAWLVMRTEATERDQETA